jgi:hypothetical protein
MPADVMSAENDQQPPQRWEALRKKALKKHNLWEKYGGDDSA